MKTWVAEERKNGKIIIIEVKAKTRKEAVVNIALGKNIVKTYEKK